jgi:hypothetical protein
MVFWLTWAFQVGVMFAHDAISRSAYLFAFASVLFVALALIGSLVAVLSVASLATNAQQNANRTYAKPIISTNFCVFFAVLFILSSLVIPQYTIFISLVLSVLSSPLFLMSNPAWLAMELLPEIRACAESGRWFVVFRDRAIRSQRELLRVVLVDRWVAVAVE